MTQISQGLLCYVQAQEQTGAPSCVQARACVLTSPADPSRAPIPYSLTDVIRPIPYRVPWFVTIQLATESAERFPGGAK